MAEASAPDPASPVNRVQLVDADKMPRWVPRAIALGALAFLMTGVVGWLFERLSGILVTVLVSLFLSFALEPTVNRLSQRGMKRGLATGLVFLGLVLFAIGFIVLVGKLLVDQVTAVIENAPQYVAEIQAYAHRTLNWDVNLVQLQEQLGKEDGPARKFANELAGNAVGVGSSALGVVFQGFTVLMFSFYLVAEGPKARRTVCARLSPARQQRVLQTWEIAIDKTGGYLSSRAILLVFSASFASIAFTVLDLPSAVAIALLFALIAQVIPVIGTYVGGSVAVLVALANRPVSAVWVVLYIVIYQQIESYLIAPRVTSRTMQLHPAIALGSVIVGAGVLGVIGTVLALPAAAVIQAIFSTSLQQYEVIESAMTKQEEEPGTNGESGGAAGRRHGSDTPGRPGDPPSA